MTVDRVALSVPKKGEYARTARLTAGELASRVGMGIDDVDDLKLAVEEAFVLASASPESDEVTFAFDVGEDAIEVFVGPLLAEECSEEESDAGERYARFILDAVCDHCDYVQVDGSCHLHLVKRRG